MIYFYLSVLTGLVLNVCTVCEESLSPDPGNYHLALYSELLYFVWIMCINYDVHVCN